MCYEAKIESSPFLSDHMYTMVGLFSASVQKYQYGIIETIMPKRLHAVKELLSFAQVFRDTEEHTMLPPL